MVMLSHLEKARSRASRACPVRATAQILDFIHYEFMCGAAPIRSLDGCSGFAVVLVPVGKQVEFLLLFQEMSGCMSS